MKSIRVKGAYGPHNLGDDLLYVLINDGLKKRLGDEFKILVGVENIGRAKKIREDIDYCLSTEVVHADFLVLGGGGQFFSFEKNEAALTRKVKYYFLALCRGQLVKLLKRKVLKDRFRKQAGFCLGIGPFDSTVSKKNALNKIGSMDYLSVRDEVSKRIASNVLNDVKLYTDPVFTLSGKSIRSSGKKIGVVLRDWDKDEFGRNVINKLKQHLVSFSDAGYDVELILLSHRDEAMIDGSLENIPRWVWRADSDPCDVIDVWAARYDTVISTRAHGVLVAALAGCNVVALPLESKLERFHMFFEKSSHFVCKDEFFSLNSEGLKAICDKGFCINQRIEEIRVNRAIAEEAFDSICGWMRGV